jgi:hypothetical protein
MGFPENGLYHQPIRRKFPMRHRHLSPAGLIRQPGWDAWLADVLGLTDYSHRTPRTLLARCLLVASALGAALSAVARRVADSGRETVRKGIAAALPTDVRQLEHRLAGGFRRVLPRALRKRSVPVAIDLHRRPYYGDHDHTAGVTGAQSENGTNWFWSYATAASLLPGHRHTLAVTAVGPDDTLTAVVERLLAQVNWTGIEVRYVLLDRAFCAVGVVSALAKRNMRFITPMVRRGKAARFFGRGCRGWYEYTLRARRRSEGTAAVRVAVVPDTGRASVFACSAGWRTAAQVALVYGRRFGIESSYRQLGECLAQTTGRDVVYRLLLVGVSLLIRAWWVDAPGTTVSLWRWELILAFTADTEYQHTTQTGTPQIHTAKTT